MTEARSTLAEVWLSLSLSLKDTLAEVIISIKFSIFSRSTGTLLYQIKWLELVGAWSTLAEVWPSLNHCIRSWAHVTKAWSTLAEVWPSITVWYSLYHCIRYWAQVTGAWSTLAEVWPSITPAITWRDTFAEVIISISIFSRSTVTLLYQIKWLELVRAWDTLAEVWSSITPPITQLIRLRVTIPTLNTKPYIRCIIIISSELRAGLNRPKLSSRRLVVTNQCNQRGPVLMDVGSSAWRDFTFNSRADFDWLSPSSSSSWIGMRECSIIIMIIIVIFLDRNAWVKYHHHDHHRHLPG